MQQPNLKLIRNLFILILVVIVLIVLLVFSSNFFYFLQPVQPDEIGLQYKNGQITNVVTPGVYSDFGLFTRLERYKTSAYVFSADDAEVITSDNQRLGVTVSGSVFLPNLSTKSVDEIRDLWVRYQTIYKNDNDSINTTMTNLAQQAMKVCVGNKPFKDSVIGSNRDSLRSCIDDELNNLAGQYGLTVANITVPQVLLSPEVQSLLDAITKSRLETEKASQDKLKAEAEGIARKAAQEAEIRVEQSKQQEESKQQTLLAELKQKQIEAERKVIEAQKGNDLLAAQKDMEINTALAKAAQEKAKAELANEITLGNLLQSDPAYAYYKNLLANSAAIKETDKIIFVPQGTVPSIVLGGNATPVIPVTPSGQ